MPETQGLVSDSETDQTEESTGIGTGVGLLQTVFHEFPLIAFVSRQSCLTEFTKGF